MFELGQAEWQAIWLTIRLCFFTTVILLIIATPLAWWLSSGRSRWRVAVQAIVALPLVLPLPMESTPAFTVVVPE